MTSAIAKAIMNNTGSGSTPTIRLTISASVSPAFTHSSLGRRRSWSTSISGSVLGPSSS
ncbi:hypothetical protein FQZ97_850180 [compost metagenome]